MHVRPFILDQATSVLQSIFRTLAVSQKNSVHVHMKYRVTVRDLYLSTGYLAAHQKYTSNVPMLQCSKICVSKCRTAFRRARLGEGARLLKRTT